MASNLTNMIFNRDYKIQKKLGSGAFGDIFQAINKKT